MSRKRVPLNQNECTANFRIGVPFEQNLQPMDMVNFAVASSVIKHTIRGDGNITDDVSTIRNLMNMNYDIKR